ncbi:hypothetical protein FNF29_01396 [Cafeteria roenbergensis]|uniref:Phosphoglycerate mutase n=2 Tax=Cafeteria roenbergensis TaxID=33653 RepID=A0A5A8CU16_CAFRO|nr:hypothetical protein FNF29_01396 [Cafeteria roenbergensis]|eukprot:KAA0155977.1 hypothetical protein FNF29_01396 [Cafeteria roenbergensis]
MASASSVAGLAAGASAAPVAVRASRLSPVAGAEGVPPGARVVHFIRHAEGTHNKARTEAGTDEEYSNWAWLDARLTDTGEAQAAALGPELLLEANRVEVVLVSPLSRAIHTGLLAFPAGDASPPFEAVEDLRERLGSHPCDKRRSKAELRADFPGVNLDGLLTEEDTLWREERESQHDLAARAARFLGALMQRPERRIGVCTHNDFLVALMRKSGLRVPRKDRSSLFRNAERRAYLLQAEAAAGSDPADGKAARSGDGGDGDAGGSGSHDASREE